MSEQEVNEYESDNLTSHPVQCKQCRRLIGFKDKKPYDVKFISDNTYKITDVAHWNTCPVKIRERIEEHCAWCQLIDRKVSIISIRGLFGYETCMKHGYKNEEFQYRGHTLKRTTNSLELMYQDAIRQRKRKLKRSERPRGNEGIEGFL
jgi:hypothetical protein